MSGLIQHFIDDLIMRADIVDVLSKRIDLKKAGKEFKQSALFTMIKTHRSLLVRKELPLFQLWSAR